MRLQDAWPLHFPDDEYLSVTSKPTFYVIKHRYNGLELTKRQWPWAEVVHLNNDLRYIQRFRDLKTDGKGIVIHHHGTMFRTRPDYHLEALEQYKATAIMSTVDLWAMAPEQTTWMPQAYQLHELQSYRNPHPEDGILRIAHAPTNRAIKGTMALDKAVRRMRANGVRVELDIIERTSNVKCMQRKGRADVFVDQMLLGYGCNAVEAWGMGLPVIAGVDPDRCPTAIYQTIPSDTRDRMLQLWGSMPFLETTEDNLFDALMQMTDPKVRKKYAKKGMAHFLRFHEAGVVTEKLRGIYQQALQ